jgi:hypothetical protein
MNEDREGEKEKGWVRKGVKTEKWFCPFQLQITSIYLES